MMTMTKKYQMKTQSQKNLTYEFSTLDKVATEKEDVKSSLGSEM